MIKPHLAYNLMDSVIGVLKSETPGKAGGLEYVNRSKRFLCEPPKACSHYENHKKSAILEAWK